MGLWSVTRLDVSLGGLILRVGTGRGDSACLECGPGGIEVDLSCDDLSEVEIQTRVVGDQGTMYSVFAYVQPDEALELARRLRLFARAAKRFRDAYPHEEGE